MSGFRIDVVRDGAHHAATDPAVDWAVERLTAATRARGGASFSVDEPDPVADVVVTVARSGSRPAIEAASLAGIEQPVGPETLAIVPGPSGPVAIGGDARGTSYALLELADRVELADDPVAALRLERPIEDHPANEVRSVARLFCSDVEDTPWFRGEEFWRRYLSMLAANRFNRFSLTLGLGYNYPRDVTDAYLYFAYPFLLSVPGYDVRVPQLPDEERERNLDALRFASEQAVARGLDFQLGLWTHAYEWIDSPDARHTIEGLTPETHAPYCRDAIATLLEACPAIGGVTLRIHGESGVPEGSRGFWRGVFQGIAGCGRPVGIDLHAKGLDERTLNDALETGLPVTVSPKFWAEHMGLPYHQAAIRERERIPRADPSALSRWHRDMNVSEGSRPFTRYGYADFLREDRPYRVVHRLWAGTQRVLMWGDPAFAAGYGRASNVAGTQGIEWCEPLTFKGREGSGVEGSRTGYADGSLVPRDDWEKFAYAYRLFGRLTYDPEAPAEVWQRPLRRMFGAAAPDAEAALASASRILPLVTVAHHPSASNNYYWPEMYTDMPIAWSVDELRPHPYIDAAEPRRFGTVSPLDPEVFSSIADYVAELRTGALSGRVSPVDVARHLERLAGEAAARLYALEARLPDRNEDLRRWSADVSILAALGRFFSGKIRAAVGYERYLSAGERDALPGAVAAYRSALVAWQDAAARADRVYVADLTYGPQDRLRGHWRDRVEAIEADMRDIEALLDGTRPIEDLSDAPTNGDVEPPREIGVVHHPPPHFRPGEDLRLMLGVNGAVARTTLRYRPMNQALPVSSLGMNRDRDQFVAVIPGVELDASFPLAYAFVLQATNGYAWRYPAIGADLTGQPYVVVRSRVRRPKLQAWRRGREGPGRIGTYRDPMA
jgi:hypothetical protein